MRRVSPDTASKAAAAKSHRPKPRPVSQETMAPRTAPPAPTGAITLPTQLMKFKNAPSGWAPVSPLTATAVCGAAPRFCVQAYSPVRMMQIPSTASPCFNATSHLIPIQAELPSCPVVCPALERKNGRETNVGRENLRPRYSPCQMNANCFESWAGENYEAAD